MQKAAQGVAKRERLLLPARPARDGGAGELAEALTTRTCFKARWGMEIELMQVEVDGDLGLDFDGFALKQIRPVAPKANGFNGGFVEASAGRAGDGEAVNEPVSADGGIQNYAAGDVAGTRQIRVAGNHI